jgi:RNA polymerase sigma-70 factor (ECF subfamily)
MKIEELYDEHVDKVYRFFYIKSFDKSIAEDLTSQTFMTLCEQMQDPVRAIQDHKKFLYGIMRNHWLMYLRQKYRRGETTIENIEDFADYVEEEISDYSGLTARQRAEVYINQLPEKQRDIVARRLLEERSIKDIAADIGKDSNYVKTTYKRGLKRLRQLIDESAAEHAMPAGREMV